MKIQSASRDVLMIEDKDRIDECFSDRWKMYADMKMRPKGLDISQGFSPVHQADGYLFASPRRSRHSKLRRLSVEKEKEKEHASSCNVE